MTELLVDTDVLIDHLRGHRRLPADGGGMRFSSITRAELFAGPEHQIDHVRSLLSALTEIELNAGIAELGGRISRSASIPLPDALIAATALSRGLTLLTRNRRHFERVDGLEVRGPTG